MGKVAPLFNMSLEIMRAGNSAGGSLSRGSGFLGPGNGLKTPESAAMLKLSRSGVLIAWMGDLLATHSMLPSFP